VVTVTLEDREKFKAAFARRSVSVPVLDPGQARLAERQEEAAEELSEHALAVISINDQLDDPAIAKLIKHHESCIKPEVAAFEGYRWLDDVIADTTVVDPRKFGTVELKKHTEALLGKRRKRLHAIHEAMEDAKRRQRQLGRLLEAHRGHSAKAGAVKEVETYAAGMLNHIPEAFLVESERLAQRIEALCRAPEEQEAEKQQAMDIPDDVRRRERAVFEEVIEHGSLKKMDRTAFYFDEPMRALTGEQQLRLINTYEGIIQRAYRIRDAGGSIDEVEASLAHVPAEFWPPAFIRSLQAWRKVERELAHERAQALFDKEKGNPLSDAKDCFDFAMSCLGFVGLTTDLGGLSTSGSHGAQAGTAFIPCAWRDAPAAVEATAAFLGVVQSGWGYGAHVYEAMQSQDFDVEAHPELADLPARIARENEKFSNTMAKIAEEATEAAKTAIGLTSNVVWGLSALGVGDAGYFAAEYIPVLCAVAAGIELAEAIAALTSAIRMKSKTGKMLDEAELQWVSGQQSDGGAFVRALKNERSARSRQVAKKSVDVTAKSAVFAGEVTLTTTGATGFGAAAGLGLKITGKSIEYGNTIVFAGIDWGIARSARELLQEAQAGNPIARMQIMEDSGLYAKMYICILAREGDPLATKFITERGISEADLRKPAVALSVLREAMLKHADQKDETKVSKNLGEHIAREVAGDGTVNVVKGAGKGIAKLARGRERRAGKHPYDPDATLPMFPTAAPDRWVAAWSAAKQAAEKSGYYPEKTGLKDALSDCVEPVTAASAAVKSYSPDTGDPAVLADLVDEAVRRLSRAVQVATRLHPQTNEGGTHKPMADWIGELRRTLMIHANTLDSVLFERRIKDTDWTAPRAAEVSPTVWTRVWSSAVASCRVPADDGGVAAGLRIADDIWSGGRLEGTPKERRDARIEIRDALKQSAVALKALWTHCTEFPGLMAFLDEMMAAILAASQDNDEALNGRPWSDNPAATPDFSGSLWRATLAAAEREGFIASARKDHGVGEALDAFAAKEALLARTTDPVALRGLRKEAMAALVSVAKRSEKIIADSRDTHAELTRYFLWIRATAGHRAAALRQSQAAITFTRTTALTAAAWKATLTAAADAGAVPRSKTALTTLSDALKDHDKHSAAMMSAKTPRERFKLAGTVKADLLGIQQAISSVSDLKGFSDNDHMETHLADLRDLVSEAERTDPLAAILSGAGSSFPPQVFTWKNRSGWQVVKAAAEEGGLIEKSRNKTGFGDAIEDAAKAGKALKKATKPKDRIKRIESLLPRLDAVTQLARQLQGQTGNANFSGYFQQAIDQAVSRRSTAQEELTRLKAG
jgi:hypothetical protein